MDSKSSIRNAFKRGYQLAKRLDEAAEAADAAYVVGIFLPLRKWLRNIKDFSLKALYKGKQCEVVITPDGSQLVLLNKRNQKILTVNREKVDYIKDSLITLQSGDTINLMAYGQYTIPDEVFNIK